MPMNQRAGLHALDDGALQALAAEPFHGRRAGADAGDEDDFRAVELLGRLGHRHHGTQQAQGVADGDEVAGAVVDHGDTDGIAHLQPPAEGGSEPLVEAMPERRGSGATAMRSARASALKAASARW